MTRKACLLLLIAVAVPAASAQEWKAQISGTINPLDGVWFTTAQRGFAVGDLGAVLRTTDGGQTWTPIVLTNDDVQDVAFSGTQVGLLVGDNGAIFRSVNGGDTWAAVASATVENLDAVAFGDGGLAYAAGRNGTIVRSADFGATWSLVASGDERYRSLAAVGNRGWAVGNDGAIRASVDGGLTWTALDAGTIQDIQGVSFVSKTEGWIAGQNNLLRYTNDGGQTWTTRNTAIAVGLDAVFFGNRNLGWTSGAAGTIYRSTNGALSWQPQNTQAVDDLNDIMLVDAFHGWAVGDNGSIVALEVPTVEITLDADTIDWQPWPGAAVYDVVQGDLVALRNSGGNFAASTEQCMAENETLQSVAHGPDPASGEALWFLVRVVADGQNRTYDSGSFRQLVGRDAGIAASGFDCF